jgi:hypothetical protein
MITAETPKEEAPIVTESKGGIETTKTEEVTGAMDSLFGFSVEENTTTAETPAIIEIITPVSTEEGAITLIDDTPQVHEDDMSHVLIPDKTEEAPIAVKNNTGSKDDKIESMLQDFIEQLNEHKVHMLELDELNELKLRDINYRQESVEKEYKEKIRLLNLEKEEIIGQKQEKQEKAKKLEKIIAALEEQCEV